MAWNKIFRMSIIREHELRFPPGLTSEDNYFWQTYQPWCRGKAFVREPLYLYRQRAGSIMSDIKVDRGTVLPDLLRVVAMLGEYYDRHGLMKNEEWAAFYWEAFDLYVGMSQMHRPERFRSHTGKRKRRSLGATIRRGFEKLKNKIKAQ
jgi:hypothetical protein